MKLYELNRSKEGIKIYYEGISDGSKYIRFFHVDGMYSYCVTEKGNTIHLSVSTPIEKYEDGYRITNQHKGDE